MTPLAWIIAMLVAVSALYGAASIAYHFSHRPGMALAFVGYVVANAGLILDAIQQARN